MANQIVSGDSKEAVAYALLLGIAAGQSKIYNAGNQAGAIPVVSADEKWVLETYAKCLQTVYKGKVP